MLYIGDGARQLGERARQRNVADKGTWWTVHIDR